MCLSVGLAAILIKPSALPFHFLQPWEWAYIIEVLFGLVLQERMSLGISLCDAWLRLAHTWAYTWAETDLNLRTAHRGKHKVLAVRLKSNSCGLADKKIDSFSWSSVAMTTVFVSDETPIFICWITMKETLISDVNCRHSSLSSSLRLSSHSRTQQFYKLLFWNIFWSFCELFPNVT